jgi:hypothetical protein
MEPVWIRCDPPGAARRPRRRAPCAPTREPGTTPTQTPRGPARLGLRCNSQWGPPSQRAAGALALERNQPNSGSARAPCPSRAGPPAPRPRPGVPWVGGWGRPGRDERGGSARAPAARWLMVVGWRSRWSGLRAPSVRETGVSAWRWWRVGCVVGSARRKLVVERWARPETPVSRRIRSRLGALGRDRCFRAWRIEGTGAGVIPGPRCLRSRDQPGGGPQLAATWTGNTKERRPALEGLGAGSRTSGDETRKRGPERGTELAAAARGAAV